MFAELRRLVIVTGLLSLIATVSTAQTTSPALPDAAVTKRVYFLVDRSSSMDGFQPPETTQAVIQHVLELASLAKQPVEVCVITYGLDGVQVFGDEHGRPTAAYESLQRKLFRDWPKADGGTPMDEAFKVLLDLLRETPGDVENVVVNITDGEPDSARLRPDEFAEIAELISQRRKDVLETANKYPPAIQQELLRRFEEPLRDPNTREFMELYERQRVAEYQKTLEYAKALAGKKLRFLTVDYVGILNLEEIHATAGGVPEDLLRVSPNQVIGALHQRRITALPRIVQLPSQMIAADAQSFALDIEIPIDAIAEAASVSIELQPAVPDFFANCRLTAQVDGNTFSFNPDDGCPETSITRDAQGNVATASLRLNALRSGSSVRIRWESSNGRVSQPAMQVYTFARLKESLVADLRPEFLSQDASPPFQVSHSYAAEYVFRLRDSESDLLVPVTEVEAVFRSVGLRGQTIRATISADPGVPGQVRSDKLPLPPGTYDIDLFIRLPSGIEFSLSLDRHLEVVFRNEAIAVEVPLASDSQPSFVSSARSHVDFGRLGDDVAEVTREILVRTVEFDHPVRVRFAGAVTDENGSAPTTSWLTFQPELMTLRPGKSARLRITLKLPAKIETELVDGLFEGAFSAELVDTGVSLPIQRLEPISGVPDDAPVEKLTFELKRPRVSVAAPYALRNWIQLGPNRNLTTTVRVDIDQRFRRIVTVVAEHDSVLDRTVSVVPSGLVTDNDGRSVPQLRLVPAEGTELTQTIAPGASASWRFEFEIDDDCEVLRAETGLDIYGDGLVIEHVTVRIQRRDPLLAGWIVWVTWCLIACLVFVLLRAILPLRRVCRLCTGAVLYLTATARNAQLLAVEKLVGKRIQLRPLLAMETSDSVTGVTRRLPVERMITIHTDEISTTRPYVLKVPGDEPTILHIIEVRQTEDGDPEVCVQVMEGGNFDTTRWRLTRRIKRCLCWGLICAAFICTLNHPAVLMAVQWVHDAIFFV